MNYAEIINESLEQLQVCAKKQKKARYGNRVRFLSRRKSRTGETQKQAGELVGGNLRYAQKMWKFIRNKDVRL